MTEAERAPANVTGGAPEAIANLAGTATRLALNLGGAMLRTGRHAVDRARHGASPPSVATAALNELATETVDVLDAELRRIRADSRTATASLVERVPGPVKQAVETVGDVPNRVLGAPSVNVGTGSAHDIREEARALLKQSLTLDAPDMHPAMARILSEISPDEARIIRHLAETGPHAVMDLVAHNPWTRKFRPTIQNFSLVGREAGCLRPGDTPIYLNNLERLGVVAIRPFRMRSQRNYDLIMAQPQMRLVEKPAGRLVRLKKVHKGVELSGFGRELFRAAFETDESQLAAVPNVL